MKILELRFKNLNSLYGEWHIDFTAPEYEGIFALTGPTGAGKSTILDALCLALYGATPRLGKITQSGNEIMSRRTGECYAELVFQSREGRYRCRWDQRRARKSADGALQAPEHQIADAESGTILEEKRSRVGAVIEEKTGMDFERFTRSVLLAQGSFDSFLKADAEKKSSILEQITGTAVYTEISRKVHERLRDEQERLDLLEAGISGISLLSNEEVEELKHQLEEKTQADLLLDATRTETAGAVGWLKTIASLQKELELLSFEETGLQKEIQAFTPEKLRLTEARKASVLEGDYSSLNARREQLATDQEALKGVRSTLPSLEAAFEEQSALLRNAEQETLKARKEQEEALPRIKQARAMDQSLTDLNRNIAQREGKNKEASRELMALKERREELEERLLRLKEEARESEAYLNEHAGDEILIGRLAGIEEVLDGLQNRRQEILRREEEHKQVLKDLESIDSSLNESKRETGEARKKQDSVQKKLNEQRKALEELLEGKLLREHRAEKEALLREKSLRDRIATLEEQRAALEDGAPCPLCGAIHHPYAGGNIPSADETEQKIKALSDLIDRAERQEELLKGLEENLRRTVEELQGYELRLAALKQEKKSLESSLKGQKKALKEARELETEQAKKCRQQLQPLGINEIPEKQIPALRQSLRERLEAWRNHADQAGKTEKELGSIEAGKKRLSDLFELREEAQNALVEELKTLNIERMTVTTNRWSIFGEKDPDAEEQRLNTLTAAAESKEKSERSTLEIRQSNYQNARSREETLTQRIKASGQEMQSQETAFLTALEREGFTDEESFLQSRLSPGDLNSLAERSRILEDRETELRARREDRKARLSGEKEKKLSKRSLAELEEEGLSQEEALKSLREETAGIRQRLASHREAEEKLKEKRTALEGQKKECRRWEKLHGLIGSADGKKYRNFAQGLTFELMVSHANRQLEKMSDRYLLLRDGEEPLALNVVDNYQAGEIRSVKNLSGGESFLISLSLALGLSRMASRKVRVDSLFLDEGFGTLDEDALETALETLAGLHQDGKTIGIISHVAALKERISTQISVSPSSGGRSTVNGPGCRRITDDENG